MYLGDGAYARRSDAFGYFLELYTSDGESEGSCIFIDYQMWEVLKCFAESELKVKEK